MIQTPEQFASLNKASFEMMHTAARVSMAGFERLAALNLQAARSSFEESADMMKSLFEVKDVKSLSELTTTSMQPAADKASAYAKHCYDIASETNAELARLVEKQMADGNKQLFAAIDSMARNAPAGSEGVMTLVKSAVSAANTRLTRSAAPPSRLWKWPKRMLWPRANRSTPARPRKPPEVTLPPHCSGRKARERGNGPSTGRFHL